MADLDRLTSAVARAETFLETGRSRDCLWRDFRTLAGASSEWVTGFVAYAMARAGGKDHARLEAVKALVRRQRRSGGWAYSEPVPSDGDSTAWALLAIATVPSWRPSVIERGLRFLKAHRHADTGGFATYVPSDGIHRFIGVPSPWTAGWLETHPCVTAVALQALLIHGEARGSPLVQQAARYLLREARSDGTWHSYWWSGYAYGTYHALRALSLGGWLEPARAEAAARTLLGDQGPDGSWGGEVFATSLNALALMLAPTADRLAGAERAIEWLLDAQYGDGSFSSAPILRIPPPMVAAPEGMGHWRVDELGTGVLLTDAGRLFTSASALWALSVYRSTRR